MTKLQGEQDYTLATRGTLVAFSNANHALVRVIEGVTTIGEAFAFIADDANADAVGGMESMPYGGDDAYMLHTLAFFAEGYAGDVRELPDVGLDGDWPDGLLWFDGDNSADVDLFSYGNEYVKPDDADDDAPDPFALAVYDDGGPQRDWWPND